MGKAEPKITIREPSVKDTIYGISRFLFSTATLWTQNIGAADEYGKKDITWISEEIKCRIGYYTKTKEEELPMGYEEMDLRLIITEPNALPERGYIEFDTGCWDAELFEILTVTKSVHIMNVVYDRGIIRKALTRPQGINP